MHFVITCIYSRFVQFRVFLFGLYRLIMCICSIGFGISFNVVAWNPWILFENEIKGGKNKILYFKIYSNYISTTYRHKFTKRIKVKRPKYTEIFSYNELITHKMTNSDFTVLSKSWRPFFFFKLNHLNTHPQFFKQSVQTHIALNIQSKLMQIST